MSILNPIISVVRTSGDLASNIRFGFTTESGNISSTTLKQISIDMTV